MTPPSDAKLKALSEFARDLAKILFGAAIVGFFLPDTATEFTLPAFLVSLTVGVGLLYIGIAILPSNRAPQATF